MQLFISYAHVDKAIVKDWIVDKLVAGSHNVWFDDRLVTGQDWKQQLSDAIQASDALVYCMTPKSIASDWCQWELAQAVDFGKPVIPVLLQARTNLPDQLKHLQYVDFSDGATGDAVARLMGGLQQLSPSQIPPAPQDPQGKPAQAVDPTQKGQSNRMMKILRDPAGQAIIGILSIIITIIIALTTINSSPPSSGNPTLLVSTPATPQVIAQINLDIRSGPGSEFNSVRVLADGDSLDIIGITDDGLWYQVLMSDGSYGWVIAGESFGRFEGNRSVLRIVTPTATNTLASLPTQTPTIPPTFEPSATVTESASNTPAQIDSPTMTTTPSGTAVAHSTYTQAPEATVTTPTLAVEVSSSEENECTSQFGIDMVYIPQTTFMMGNENGPSNERPIREVTVSAFCIDVFEVTNVQYSRCVNDGVCTSPRSVSSRTAENYFDSPIYNQFPVVNVTWENAQTYCEYAGGRLPTEAEWELASRYNPENSSVSTYPWGENPPTSSLANFAGRGINDTVEVGQHPSGVSYYQIHDMSGNVAEWTYDWFGPYTSNVLVDPLGAEEGDFIVVRGGSFESDNEQLTTTARDRQSPNVPSDDVGFRCVNER